MKSTLRPEIYNRIGKVICFESLGEDELKQIVDIQLRKLGQKLQDDREITLKVTPEAMDFLAKESYDPAYGARPVKRTIQRMVESPLASIIIGDEVVAGQTLVIGYEEEELPVEPAADGEEAPAPEKVGTLTFGVETPDDEIAAEAPAAD